MRPQGHTAKPPKLILAKINFSFMSTTEASGQSFFSILYNQETRKSVILFYIRVYYARNFNSFLFIWGFRPKLIILAYVVDIMSTTEVKINFSRN